MGERFPLSLSAVNVVCFKLDWDEKTLKALLIKRNIPVTIFDRHEPLSTNFRPASYGNAGHFSPYAVLQLNRPDILYDVPKMLFSSNGPLALKWNHVPKMLPWILGYLKNSPQTAFNMMQQLASYARNANEKLSVDAFSSDTDEKPDNEEKELSEEIIKLLFGTKTSGLTLKTKSIPMTEEPCFGKK